MNVFYQHFKNRVTFSRASYSEETIGQEKKTLTTVYSQIPCNFIRQKDRNLQQAIPGQQEITTQKWRCDVHPKYNLVVRGDEATISGRTFTVEDTEEKVDMLTGKIAFVYYYLIEKK